MAEVETIADIVALSGAAHGASPALQTFGDEGLTLAYTFGEAARLSELLARRLAASGAARGGHVALVGENCPEWAVAALGVYRSGAALVPIDAKLKAGEIRNILGRAKPRLVLSARRLLPLAEEAAAGLDRAQRLCLEDLLGESALAEAARLPPAAPAPCRPDDAAIVSFTSGTTGPPKGIVLTHRNIVANVEASRSAISCGPTDAFVSLLPLNHLFEHTVGFLLPLRCGARVTYLRSIKPRTVLAAIEASGATLCLIVPAVARLFYKEATARIGDLPAWRRRLFRGLYGAARGAGRAGIPLGPLILGNVGRRFGRRMRQFVCGGAPLEAEVAEFFACIGLPILQGYGLSEAAPVVSSNTVGANRVGSVGRPLGGVEVRIAPCAGFDPPAGPDAPTASWAGEGPPVGEVLVRGPNVMAGYFESPEATSEVLRQGWLHTGDLGWLDSEGFLYICGRLKDVIIGESGKNVYPAEVEQEIAARPGIKEVCVLGRRVAGPAGATELVVALVAPTDELAASLGGDELRSLLRREIQEACRRLADYKQPRYFAVWQGELPKTTTLKFRKHEIARELDGLPLEPV